MTPEQIEKHRKRFEELSNRRMDISKDHEDRYLDTRTHSMWRGYLLFAENMEIEIPGIHICYDSKEDKVRHLDYEDFVYELKSQGIKIKSSGSEWDDITGLR